MLLHHHHTQRRWWRDQHKALIFLAFCVALNSDECLMWLLLWRFTVKAKQSTLAGLCMSFFISLLAEYFGPPRQGTCAYQLLQATLAHRPLFAFSA